MTVTCRYCGQMLNEDEYFLAYTGTGPLWWEPLHNCPKLPTSKIDIDDLDETDRLAFYHGRLRVRDRINTTLRQLDDIEGA